MVLRSVASLLGALLLLAACNRPAPGPETEFQGRLPDGQVEMREVQAAYIGSGNAGTGVLYFRGQAYPFNVGGLGIGGIGLSEMQATGDVYNLPDLRLFPGAYVQGRYGVVLGRASSGDLWLTNQQGVVMHLKAKREGLMLTLGGDAVVISMRR